MVKELTKLQKENDLLVQEIELRLQLITELIQTTNEALTDLKKGM